MKIVVLDGYAMNPGDLSWDMLNQLGDVTVYDRTPADLIVERSRTAEFILTNKVCIWRETMDQLPQLRYIGVLATGYNVVDVPYATEKGITVTNVPAYSTESVAELAFALLLELCRRTQKHSDAVISGRWSSSPDFSFWLTPQIELAGKTMGILGFGRIGRQVARIADAFGMKILASDRHPENPPSVRDFAWAENRRILQDSDVVSLHFPLTPETQGFINKESIDIMKPTAFLLNTSRGPLVLEQDLADALNTGRIAGAGLDVLAVEPPPAGNPLFTARNCIITPHIAWATLESRERLMEIVVDNLKAFQAGITKNTVNGR
jgi:glycerate dehydrogenase